MLAVEYAQGIEDAWSEIATFVPKLVAAIVVFIIGWIIAKIIRRVLVRILERIGFDGWVDKAGIGAPLERGGYPSSAVLVGKIIYFGLMLLVLQLTFGVFGDNEISDALDSLIAFIPRLLVAIVIIIITGAVASGVRALIEPAVAHLSAGDLLAKAAFVAIWVIGAFAAIDQLQVAQNVTAVLFQTLVYGLGLILVISLGVGGIASARERFWPAVYDRMTGGNQQATDPSDA